MCQVLGKEIAEKNMVIITIILFLSLYFLFLCRFCCCFPNLFMIYSCSRGGERGGCIDLIPFFEVFSYFPGERYFFSCFIERILIKEFFAHVPLRFWEICQICDFYAAISF
jgi:hypothetical protein